MDPTLRTYLDEIKASINNNGDKMTTISQQLDTQTVQLSDLCSWKPDLEDRFAKLQATVADLQRAQPTTAAADGGSVAAHHATRPLPHIRASLRRNSDLLASVTASTGATELATMSAREAQLPALVPSIGEPLAVAPDAPINTIAMVPASCSTECAAQAIPASTLLPRVSVSSSSQATSETNGVVCTELAPDNDDNDMACIELGPDNNTGQHLALLESSSLSSWQSIQAQVLVLLVVPSAATATADDIGGVVLDASCCGVVRVPVTCSMKGLDQLIDTELPSSWHQEHMHCHTPWPPPYLYLSWCDSSKPRPIPWPSFDDLPAAGHLTEPWPPPQGTSGEFSVAVDVIYHFPDSLSWITPLHICLHYELDIEESVISVRRTVDLEERFTSLGMSLNISEKNLKKTHTESIEVTVSDLIIGGASVFQQWLVPWISFLFLDLTSTEGYGLILFQWSTGWQLDEECSDYYQLHVALALPVSSTSKDSECVLAGVSPPECSLGVQYCHGNIFEGCQSVYMAMVMLLYRNYSPLNSWSGYTALQCTTASVVQMCKLMYGNKRLAWGIISDVFLKCNQYVCCVDALKPWSLLERMVHICWLLLQEQVSKGVAVLDMQCLRYKILVHLADVTYLRAKPMELFPGDAASTESLRQLASVCIFKKGSMSWLEPPITLIMMTPAATLIPYLDKINIDNIYDLEAFQGGRSAIAATTFLQQVFASHKYYFDWVPISHDYYSYLVEAYPNFGYYDGSNKVKDRRMHWDPGGLSAMSAWGQAEFQGGRDVRSYPTHTRTGLVSWATTWAWPRLRAVLQVPGRRQRSRYPVDHGGNGGGGRADLCCNRLVYLL